MAKFFIGDEAHWLYNFSMNLRDMIKEKKTSAAKLARCTGIADWTIRAYTNARSMPSEENIQLLANALDCAISELTEKEYDYDMPGYEDENSYITSLYFRRGSQQGLFLFLHSHTIHKIQKSREKHCLL